MLTGIIVSSKKELIFTIGICMLFAACCYRQSSVFW